MEIIEVKPKALVSSYQNTIKFLAAKEKHGNKFVIITEENIVKISLEEIKFLEIIRKYVEQQEYKIFEKYIEMLN